MVIHVCHGYHSSYILNPRMLLHLPTPPSPPSPQGSSSFSPPLLMYTTTTISLPFILFTSQHSNKLSEREPVVPKPKYLQQLEDHLQRELKFLNCPPQGPDKTRLQVLVLHWVSFFVSNLITSIPIPGLQRSVWVSGGRFQDLSSTSLCNQERVWAVYWAPGGDHQRFATNKGQQLLGVMYTIEISTQMPHLHV